MKRFNPWRLSNVKWIIRNRAWSWYYVVRYLRFVKLHHFGPRAVMCTGFVFLGKGVELSARHGYGRIVLNSWVHIGDQCRIRAHEGSIHIGSKTVMGRDNTINAYLDISIGSECVISDSIYMCDFDHRFSDVRTPIRLQGITKSPVRIGDNTWIGTKVSVLRGSVVGTGSVIGAHSVVRGVIAPMSVAAGIPAKVVKSRLEVDDASIEVERHAESVRLRTLNALKEMSGKGTSESAPDLS
jgi:acetyltransferase-like isoleucine patch superfamily enzyme